MSWRSAVLLAAFAPALAGLPAAAAGGGPADPAVRVRVIASLPGLEPRARDLARRAPALVAGAARRLSLPAPAELEVVVAAAVPPPGSGQPGWLRPPAPWVGGWADAAHRRVVLYADRAPSYPHDGLEGLLAHEAAHLVLSSNLPAGSRVPRWYSEGLAMLAERDVSWRDALALARTELLSAPIPLEELDHTWPATGGRAASAYAQVLSFLAFAETRAPPAAPRRLVEALRQGLPFDRAFAAAWGRSPEATWDAWRRSQRWRWRMLPLIVAATGTPGLLGLLALVASMVFRRRRARRWALLEQEELSDG